jgi:hypothetical protein
MAADINTSPSFQSGPPKRLSQEAIGVLWDVTTAGKKFLVTRPSEGNATAPINVVLNWEAMLKK